MTAIDGLITAAPQSGSGKTLITLGLMRALNRAGVATAPAKTGPDYIDPAFLACAAAMPAVNLDPWGMRDETLRAAASLGAEKTGRLLVEGVMGLFDGAADGTGSTADLAARTGWPVLLIIDAARMSGSIAALVHGFQTYRPDVKIAGVIANRVSAPRHRSLIEAALGTLETAPPFLGAVPMNPSLSIPSRHLGLMQAGEMDNIDALVDASADHLTAHIDLEAIAGMFAPSSFTGVMQDMDATDPNTPFPAPLGQRVAVASDIAFAFRYEALIEHWVRAGASVSFFSPLDDEAPAQDADAVYLPGGYPELHAASLHDATNFKASLAAHAARGNTIFGECGGYMVLARHLIDGSGIGYDMAGLLPITVSIATPERHLGLRQVDLLQASPLGAAGTRFRAHEFHYAKVVEDDGSAQPLFSASDALGASLGPVGHVSGSVAGSFIHLIDRAP